MFPPGGPGVGLLLLRISVAARFVFTVAIRTDASPNHLLFLVAALLIGLAIAIGVVTPYLSFVVCVYALVSLFGAGSHLDILLFAALLLNSAALGLLGPGAYSVDARLFRRRVVVVPPPRDTDQT